MDYNNFILSRREKEAQLLEKQLYRERHHIIPRSQGGSDDSSNLIFLDSRDHYFAHMCLARIYGGRLWACLRLISKNTPNMFRDETRYYFEHIDGATYEELRSDFILMHDLHKGSVSNLIKGKVQTHRGWRLINVLS